MGVYARTPVGALRHVVASGDGGDLLHGQLGRAPARLLLLLRTRRVIFETCQIPPRFAVTLNNRYILRGWRTMLRKLRCVGVMVPDLLPW